MSYATPQDVKDLFRNFATTTEAAVTDAKIQKWLDSANASVNGKIGTLYQLPITEALNPLSVKILADIESFRVAAIVDDILNSYSEADKKPNWQKRADTLLNELVPAIDKDGKQPEPTTKLPDATYLGTVQQKGTFKLSSTAAPIFSKGKDNW